MEEKKTPKKNKGVLTFVIKHPKMILGIIIVLVLGIGAISIKSYMEIRNKTTNIGFEDIGELATQSATCTVVQVTEDWRKIFGKVKIPFTQSKYIYSCDFEIKAGFNFEEIEWNENNKVITVKLPEVEVLSNTLVEESAQVYHEAESKFNQIKLQENISALEGMQEEAEEKAIKNGLLDKARSNAETILTGFFKNAYDMSEYKIKFVDK